MIENMWHVEKKFIRTDYRLHIIKNEHITNVFICESLFGSALYNKLFSPPLIGSFTLSLTPAVSPMEVFSYAATSL